MAKVPGATPVKSRLHAALGASRAAGLLARGEADVVIGDTPEDLRRLRAGPCDTAPRTAEFLRTLGC
jgi:hypothetical protein